MLDSPSSYPEEGGHNDLTLGNDQFFVDLGGDETSPSVEDVELLEAFKIVLAAVRELEGSEPFSLPDTRAALDLLGRTASARRRMSPPSSSPSERSGGDSVTLIERLAELANAATPGPWSASTDPGHAPSARVRAGRRWLAQTCPTLSVASDEDFANAAYIAAVDPDTILSLIDRLAVLEEELKEIRGRS